MEHSIIYGSRAMNLSESHQSKDGGAWREARDGEEISYGGERVSYVYEELYTHVTLLR